jgi:hypothetical protein
LVSLCARIRRRSWLSERAPLINQVIDDASLLPTCDNLYLDLNGTIHNATHGDGASRKLEMKDVSDRSLPYPPALGRQGCGATCHCLRL